MEISEQINALERVKRLRGNPDYIAELLPFLQNLHDTAHANFINMRTRGSRLETARAEYVAARKVLNFLQDRQAALEFTIKEKQKM